MADNNFTGVIESLMKGMNTVLSTKNGSRGSNTDWRYDHSAACGCFLWCWGRCLRGR